MTDDRRPESGTPKGSSPQRELHRMRPRIPEDTWQRALAKARRIDRPIGHVLTDLLDQWLEEDQ